MFAVFQVAWYSKEFLAAVKASNLYLCPLLYAPTSYGTSFLAAMYSSNELALANGANLLDSFPLHTTFDKGNRLHKNSFLGYIPAEAEFSCIALQILVDPTGIEPATSSLPDWHAPDYTSGPHLTLANDLDSNQELLVRL